MHFGTVVNTTWWATCFEWWPAGPSSVTCGTCLPWQERYAIDKSWSLVLSNQIMVRKPLPKTLVSSFNISESWTSFLVSQQISPFLKMYFSLNQANLYLETLVHNSFYNWCWFIEPTNIMECCILVKTKEYNKYIYMLKKLIQHCIFLINNICCDWE